MAASLTLALDRMPPASLRDRALDWRDRLLASARFQRWAASFPLTRGVARRRSRALFDLCAGFVYAQILAACVELDLFDKLADGPQTVPVLAARLRLSPDATLRLLRAAASLKLVQARGERFGLGVHGAALRGNPAVSAMVRHHALLYADLRDPVALLRGEVPTALGAYWPYQETAAPGAIAAEAVAPYSALMAASQPMIAAEILDAYDLRRHRCLLDVGGGEAAFLTEAAARAPDLRVMLFDLPAVADRARDRLAAAGLSARASVHGGSFVADPLPTGADVVSLVRVVHDHDDDVALAILRAARAALPAGGTLLLAEPMSGTAGAEPVGDAYFGFYLLATGHGRPRTPAELVALALQAGFDTARLVPTRRPMLTRLVVASVAACRV